MKLAFFDDYQSLIKFYPSDKVIECTQTKEIPNDSLIMNNLNIVIPFDEEVAEASFVAIDEVDGNFSLFRILKTEDTDNKLFLDCIDFSANELDAYIVQEIRPRNEAMSSVARRLLNHTDGEWRLNAFDSGLPRVSGSFYYTSVKESLKVLQSYGCEIEFRCTLNSDGIHSKWINIRHKIGKVSNERYSVGSNVLEIVRKINRSDVYTSLIGRGKGEEVGETDSGEATYGRRIDFSDVVWNTRNGDPINKPRGQKYLELEAMTKLYGIPVGKNKMRRRESVVIFEDEESPEQLIKSTYEQLVKMSRPLIEFKTSVLSVENLGDTITIHDYDKGYHYSTRIFKTVVDRLTGKTDCSLGDNITQKVSERDAKQVNVVKDIQQNKTSFYDATKITKWQSDVIRGAGDEGGNVFLMSPSDVGRGDSRAPFQTVWMNGPNLESSDNFLVANNKGIGFIKGKFDSDKFATAWTIDGVLTLGEGMLQIGTNSGGKYLEATDKGLEFFNSKSSIGHIGNSAKNFPGFPGDDTESKALSIELEDAGEFFKIQTGEMNGIYVPNPDHFKKTGNDLVVANMGDKNGIVLVGGSNGFSLSGAKASLIGLNEQINMKAPKGLFLNGEEVFPGKGGGQGGGGGGWNGEYPPEVTSSADKYAWQLWAMLLTKGYSKASIAGIIGNVRGEVGVSMNPDTEQQGGPAYGCVQWDGSAYPLVGATTWNGREYVQRLMDAAKIKDDYKTMVAQAQLIEWCMYNGQWIGQVPPATVSGFKALGDPRQAAYAFEMNFERPADAHPERQAWAMEWYNKFKDLKVPEGSGKYVRPMNTPIIVTSEFGWRESPLGNGQELHNGIDIVNNNDTRIFASNSGKVIQASGEYFDWYGNWVVIEHSDGLKTGYAHLSSISVSRGDTVTKGQLIGHQGATGPVTGPHLHFQFMKVFIDHSNDNFINPRKYVQF